MEALGILKPERVDANIRVTTVGPDGRRGELERRALNHPDIEARAHVLYNLLMLRHVYMHSTTPPSLEELRDALERAPPITSNHITDEASTDSVGDVANVRARASAPDTDQDVDVDGFIGVHGYALSEIAPSPNGSHGFKHDPNCEKCGPVGRTARGDCQWCSTSLARRRVCTPGVSTTSPRRVPPPLRRVLEEVAQMGEGTDRT